MSHVGELSIDLDALERERPAHPSREETIAIVAKKLGFGTSPGSLELVRSIWRVAETWTKDELLQQAIVVRRSPRPEDRTG